MNPMCQNNSYLNKYSNEIAPVLEEIDIMIKTYEKPFSIEETAAVLGLKKKEVRLLMEKHKIKKINRKSFFCIMKHGSSDVCRLFCRETEAGLPYTYSKEEVAFIYGLNKTLVCEAFDKLGIKEATYITLPGLLSVIPCAED